MAAMLGQFAERFQEPESSAAAPDSHCTGKEFVLEGLIPPPRECEIRIPRKAVMEMHSHPGRRFSATPAGNRRKADDLSYSAIMPPAVNG
jgi:hypothetical protein